MKILVEVAKELFSMFMADAKLSLQTIALIIGVGILIKTGLMGAVISGVLLLLGCLLIIALAVIREARERFIQSFQKNSR